MQGTDSLFDPKQRSLPFTIGIIKPNTCLSIQKLAQIIETIEAQGFVIRNMIQRELFKEQVQNVFHLHLQKVYFEDILAYMLSGQCCVFLLTHPSEDPIQKWKKMIGNMDPDKARKQDPTSLRAVNGTTLIKNQLYGSDSLESANKQREVFAFPLPQSPPEYIETPYKVSLAQLRKFLHPPNLEHSSLNERMDVFAKYGPVASWHSIEVCFCSKCVKVARGQLQVSKRETKGNNLKLLKHKDIQLVREDLCEKCITHCLSFVHLMGGRDNQHVMTDNQIAQMAMELNKTELLDLLTIEKGSAAKIMVQTMEIKEPKDIWYSMDLVEYLIRQLETDFYGRYDFTQLQHLILEDRRVRMAYWVGKIVHKPPERFPSITSLDNTLTKQQLGDPKSPFFTLTRTKPLTFMVKRQELKHTDLQFAKSIVDKPKLYQGQQNIVVQKKLHRNLGKVTCIGQKNNQGRSAVALLREYNEGRHGTWDNYSGLKGNSISQPTGGKNMDSTLHSP